MSAVVAPLLASQTPSQQGGARPFAQELVQHIAATVYFPVELGVSAASEAPTVLSSLDSARALFQEIVSVENIPRKPSDMGCESRAHVISHALKQRGVTTAKLFAYGEMRIAQGASLRFHVAPMVLVRSGGEVKPYVLDVTHRDGVVSPGEWLRAMTTRGVRLDVMPAEQFLPVKRYGVTRTFEEKLPEARQTLQKLRESAAAERKRLGLDQFVSS